MSIAAFDSGSSYTVTETRLVGLSSLESGLNLVTHEMFGNELG
jgi:hypothetical protein